KRNGRDRCNDRGPSTTKTDSTKLPCMITPEQATGTPAAATQDNDDAADRALRNAGDTVRASWPFSLDNIRSNIAYMSPEAKELLVWAFTWCVDSAHPVSLDEFSSRVGYSRNLVWKLYSGK